MKKLLAIVCLVLFSTATFAQNDSNFRIKAGFGVSTLVGGDSDGMTNVFSYKLAVDYTFDINDQFAIAPGIEAANKGYTGDGMSDVVNMFVFQVPVMALYKFELFDKHNMAVKLGPYVSVGVIGSDVEINHVRRGNAVGSRYNRITAGIMAGVSYYLDNFVFSIEYSRGFTKYTKHENTYLQGIGVTVGYRL